MNKIDRAVRKPSWCSQLSGHILAHQTCFGITFLTQSSTSGYKEKKVYILSLFIYAIYRFRNYSLRKSIHITCWTGVP